MKNLARGISTLVNTPPKKLEHPPGCENNTISPKGKILVRTVITTMLLSLICISIIIYQTA
jgi:hypothetical protein